MLRYPLRPCFVTCLLLSLCQQSSAQQAPDLNYRPEIARPAYEAGKGPLVVIDQAHHNFHTAQGRYGPFAQLLRRDGYRVEGHAQPFSAEALKNAKVLVIANALHASNEQNWSLPTPSAFTKEEIQAVRAWVEKGSSLFLIADHMPFPGAADELARAFGVEFANGFAGHRDAKGLGPIIFTLGKGLKESPLAKGRSTSESVTSVTSFTGSAFKAPKDAIQVLVLGPESVSLNPQKAWEFKDDTPKVACEGWCQGAIMTVGKGRVAVFGEAAMFSAQLSGANKRPMGMNSPEAKQNYQFLLNAMHWLTNVEGMKE